MIQLLLILPLWFFCFLLNLINYMFADFLVHFFVPKQRLVDWPIIQAISKSSLHRYLTVTDFIFYCSIWVWSLLNNFTTYFILLKAMKKWKLLLEALITNRRNCRLFLPYWLCWLVWFALEHWYWWLLNRLIIYCMEFLCWGSYQTVLFILYLRVISINRSI